MTFSALGTYLPLNKQYPAGPSSSGNETETDMDHDEAGVDDVECLLFPNPVFGEVHQLETHIPWNLPDMFNLQILSSL